MGWRGLPAMGRTTQRKLYPRKINVFLIEKYIEDAKQDEKHVPNLLEAIMRPTDPVKDELEPIFVQNDLIWTQNHKNPGLIQKSKVPKWDCRWTRANF